MSQLKSPLRLLVATVALHSLGSAEIGAKVKTLTSECSVACAPHVDQILAGLESGQQST